MQPSALNWFQVLFSPSHAFPTKVLLAGAFADLCPLARLLCKCDIIHEKHTWNQPSGTAFYPDHDDHQTPFRCCWGLKLLEGFEIRLAVLITVLFPRDRHPADAQLSPGRSLFPVVWAPVLTHLCMLLWAPLSLCLLTFHTVSPSVYLIVCLKVMHFAGAVHGKTPNSFSVWPDSPLWSKGQTSPCSKHVTPALAWPVPSLVCFWKCLCLVCNESHVTLTFVLKSR